MTKYPVNEIFDSIQGEGTRTGWPSTFIRLQGCPVGCAWCDTKHTWDAGHEVTIGKMLAKSELPSNRFAWLTLDELVDEIIRRHAWHAVITGGEPAMHDLRPLTDALIDNGVAVQVETSGTYPLAVHRKTWVTCSPKINMPGGRAVREEVLRRADEIKMPVGKQRDVDLLRDKVLRFTPDARVYLQPLSCSKKATALCIAQAAKYRWAVSIQTHKYLHMR